jgi:hypothetical protein
MLFHTHYRNIRHRAAVPHLFVAEVDFVDLVDEMDRAVF